MTEVVAGAGVDHNLQSTPVKMVAGGRNHLYLRPFQGKFASAESVSFVARQAKAFVAMDSELLTMINVAA